MDIMTSSANDETECVCPIIRRFYSGINESGLWDDDAASLAPFIRRISNTRGSCALMQRRAFLCADFAVRKVAPLALRIRGLQDRATKLEMCKPLAERESTIRGRDVARSAADAAAAYAADAAAAAYANTYAYAGYAAAAANTYAYAKPKEFLAELKTLALKLLSDLCDATEEVCGDSQPIHLSNPIRVY